MNCFVYGLAPTAELAPHSAPIEIDKLVGGNTGNLAFCYAIAKQLGFPAQKSWLEERSALFNKNNIGVLTLANQIGPHADMNYFAEILTRHEARLVGVGLGAQAPKEGPVAVPEGTKRWLEIIRDRAPTSAPNVALRGGFTKSVLDFVGLGDNAIVTGCPTLFISPEKELGKSIERRWTGAPKRIAVAAGHPSWGHLAKLERTLINFLDGRQDYIVQSPLSMIEFGRGIGAAVTGEQFRIFKDWLIPESSDVDFENWRLDHAVSFFSASAWMEHLKRFDFVVGVRIHGVMLALQAGIPALCIVHDARTRELCQTMLVPYVEVSEVIGGVDFERLAASFKFDADEFDSNRLTLAARYINFLQSNQLPVAPYMKRLVG